MRGTLTIEYERCIGCNRCELACAVEHSESKDLLCAAFERVPPRSRIAVTGRGGIPIPLVCVQCDDPACAAVCPVGAIEKQETGEVVLFDGRCVGCGACVVACHLGVPIPRRDGRAYIKCDLCISRRSAGRIPACAEACLVGAIVFREDEKAGGIVVYVKRGEGEGVGLVTTGVG